MAEAKPESTKPTKKRASSLGTSFEEDALPPVIRKRKLSLGDVKDKKELENVSFASSSEDKSNNEKSAESNSIDENLSYRNEHNRSDDTLATPVNIEESSKEELLSGNALLPLGFADDDDDYDTSEKESEKIQIEGNGEGNDASTAMEAEDDRVERAAPKPKKKRNSLKNQLLENVGLIEDSANMDPESGRQTHRAAAVLAKSRLMTSTPRASNKDLTAADGDDNNNAETSGKSSSKGGRNSASASASAVSAAAISNAGLTEDQVDWVQCDRCSKWRSIAPNIDQATLAEKWFCSMNTWDSRYNNCAAPVEVFPTATTDDNTLIQSNPQSGKKSGRGGGRWKKKEVSSVSAADSLFTGEDVNNDDSDEDEKFEPLARRKPTRSTVIHSNNESGSSATTTSMSAAGAVVANVNWVQCNKCKKWRKVPETINMDDMPDKWYCTMNTWNPAYARCTAKEESDTVVATTGMEEDYMNGGVGRGGGGAARGRRTVGGNSGFSSPLPVAATPTAAPTIKKVSWVQCERKNCKKWRKVPAHIDTALFPEKWYCEMNTWDGDVASCDAPELSDSEDDHAANADTRTQLILSNSKGPGALSYRRIIFGTDGKIRPCFSDRNRNGYGIFSCSETQKGNNDNDDYTEPIRRLGYWWSSVYDETGASIVSKTKKQSNNNVTTAAAAATESVEATKSSKMLTEERPTYLLDAVRRLMDCPTDPLKQGFSKPKLIDKSGQIVASLSLLQRMKAEQEAVRSCFLLEGVTSLTLPRLITLLANSYFPNSELDAVRQHINKEALKAALKRMENEGMLLVSISSTGVLTFELVKLDTYMPPVEEGNHTFPPKMRKFFTMDKSFGVKVKEENDQGNKEECDIPHRFKKHQKWLGEQQ